MSLRTESLGVSLAVRTVATREQVVSHFDKLLNRLEEHAANEDAEIAWGTLDVYTERAAVDDLGLTEENSRIISYTDWVATALAVYWEEEA